mmetsp:Transcript_41867/g.64071  ORF Transcript_41867/g.64071 Transcript_41867/m.64071 type:complete len:97 (+) Transcript_41867:2114-2404(+)
MYSKGFYAKLNATQAAPLSSRAPGGAPRLGSSKKMASTSSLKTHSKLNSTLKKGGSGVGSEKKQIIVTGVMPATSIGQIKTSSLHKNPRAVKKNIP